MRIAPLVFQSALFLLPVVVAGQGLTTEWEVRSALDGLIGQTRRVQPLLGEVKPEQWVARGAPATYAEQWNQLRAEIGYLERTVGELAARPDQLSKAFEVYLRVQAIDSMLLSLAGGTRSYQNPALAELLEGVLAGNSSHRGTLRAYLVELAAAKEQEMRIMDEEAQRCRSQQIRQSARKPAPKQ